MENGILKGWTMLIKYFIAIFLFATVGVSFAQTLKPMSDSEFQYYERMLQNGLADQYRKPALQDKVWKDLLNDIITKIIEAKVPSTIHGWKKKGASQVPNSSQIRVLANRLRTLIEDPELEEVSKQKLQWFKNIGNGFIVLENEQKKMIRAVMGGGEKEYRELCYQYNLNIKKLEKLMNDRDKWKLSRKELVAIQKKNTAVRKKKADELKRRYEYTRKLRSDSDSKENKKGQTQKNKTTRKGARR